MNKKKLFGFTTLALMLVIGIIYFMMNSRQIEQKAVDTTELSQELKSRGYNIGIVSFSPQNKEVTVQLSDKEPNLSNTKKDIESYIKNELEDSDLMDVSVKVEIKDFEQAEIERKWMSVVSDIDKELKRESNKYTGIAIDFNPKPITYIIKSSYSKSNFVEEEISHWIELTNKVIISQNLPTLLKKDETYEIEVIDKNKEILQSKIYGNNVE